MPRRKKPHVEGNPSTPAQQDEIDVLEEVGAERLDDESVVADEERVRALGAVDVDSARENQRLNDMVGKRRGGVKGVAFNINDIPTKYEAILRLYPANSLDISMKRLTGTPVQHMITSRPGSGVELYNAIKALHGAHEEAKYEIRFFDNNSKVIRGQGQITIPDTRNEAPQMTYSFGAPPHYPPPPAVPAVPGYPAGYPPPAPPVAPPVVQAPSLPPAPGVPAATDGIATLSAMFELFRKMQETATPPTVAPPPAAPPPAFVMPPPPPPPPPGSDMPTMLAWAGQLLEIYQRMQQTVAPPAPATAPPSPAPVQAAVPPMPMVAPPVPPPPGMMFIPGWGYAPVERVMGIFAPEDSPPPRRRRYQEEDQYAPPPPREEMHPRAYEGRRYGPPGYQAPQQPPPPEKTPAQQFKDSISFIRQTVDAVQSLGVEIPGLHSSTHEATEPIQPEEDDSPIRVMEAGPAKLIIDRKSGGLRPWETGFANMDKFFKWAGEQADAWRQAQMRNQRQALPPGYVEVGPGYEAPPGFVAVPVDALPAPAPQSHRPPPPAQARQEFQPPPPMPPPIDAPQQPAWGPPPTYPEG